MSRPGLAGRLAAAVVAATFALGWLAPLPPAAADDTVPIGPPYPDRVEGQHIYDYAKILSYSDTYLLSRGIAVLELSTEADVVVYTQIKPQGNSQEAADSDARALMSQWGVGRSNGDKGVVILISLHPDGKHGQISLQVGRGYNDAYLFDVDTERAQMYDQMAAAMTRGEPGSAAESALDGLANTAPLSEGRWARFILTIAGIVAALVLVGLVVFAWAWRPQGPAYAADDSLLLAAPPPDLTPAMAALLLEKRTTTRAVAAGFTDLAARGLVTFGGGLAGSGSRLELGVAREPNSTAEVSGPEGVLYLALHAELVEWRAINPVGTVDLSAGIATFADMLEKTAVGRGWLYGEPSRIIERWTIVAVVEGLVGVAFSALAALGSLLADSRSESYPGLLIRQPPLRVAVPGLLVLAGSLLLAAFVTWRMSRSMPSRTQEGERLRAMLLARKRALSDAFSRGTGMAGVVAEKALPWASSPDEIPAWAVAFGLNEEIDSILRKTVDASRSTAGGTDWHPYWYSPLAQSSMTVSLQRKAWSRAESPGSIPRLGPGDGL
jgi:uncharacterized membrane protein YgcG